MTTPSGLPTPTALAFERCYTDDSGVEYAVRYKHGKVEMEAVDLVRFPVEEIPWLIACLQKIQMELPYDD